MLKLREQKIQQCMGTAETFQCDYGFLKAFLSNNS